MAGQRSREVGAASIAIRMRYRGEERTTELPLTQDMIGRLRLRRRSGTCRSASSSANSLWGC